MKKDGKGHTWGWGRSATGGPIRDRNPQWVPSGRKRIMETSRKPPRKRQNGVESRRHTCIWGENGVLSVTGSPNSHRRDGFRSRAVTSHHPHLLAFAAGSHSVEVLSPIGFTWVSSLFPSALPALWFACPSTVASARPRVTRFVDCRKRRESDWIGKGKTNQRGRA